MVQGHLMIVTCEVTAWAGFFEQLNRTDELTKRRGNFPNTFLSTNFFPTALFLVFSSLSQVQSSTALTPASGQLDFAINQLKLINPAEFSFGFLVESIFWHKLRWLKEWHQKWSQINDSEGGWGTGWGREGTSLFWWQWTVRVAHPVSLNCSSNVQVYFCWKGHFWFLLHSGFRADFFYFGER